MKIALRLALSCVVFVAQVATGGGLWTPISLAPATVTGISIAHAAQAGAPSKASMQTGAGFAADFASTPARYPTPVQYAQCGAGA